MRKRVCGAVLPMESKEMTEKYMQEVKRTLVRLTRKKEGNHARSEGDVFIG